MATISANGQTDIIYILSVAGNVYYNINGSSLIAVSFPLTISNTNTAYRLKVLFSSDIILSSILSYFVCGSDNIQFGLESLKEDGSRPIITIDGVPNYPGLIQNGKQGIPDISGYNNVYVYNLFIHNNGSTLVDGGGWIGQQYFGISAVGNAIINCSSDGNIPFNGGGIVGSAAGYVFPGQGSSLYIRGCSSTGTIGVYAGGIAGSSAGAGVNTSYPPGSITCDKCWSEGPIGNNGGGIFGSSSGQNNGTATATRCYSIGTIGDNGGGIFGENAGDNGGSVSATGCYSRGNIQSNAGGIFGINAGYNEGNSTAENCYSIGNIATDGGGIYGANAGRSSIPFPAGTTFATNCYSAGSITTPDTGIYGSNKGNGISTNCNSSNSSWSDSVANITLTGVPNAIVGDRWVFKGTNQPYELAQMGYNPYTTAIINASSELIDTYSQSIQVGSSSTAAIVSGKSYTILQMSPSEASITINSTTGVISTTSDTAPGTYTVYIRNTGSYNITTFTLTILPGGGSAALTCCNRHLQLNKNYYDINNNLIAGNTLISGVRSGQMSYGDMIKLKMALASKR